MSTVPLHPTASFQTAVLQDADVDMVLTDSFPASDPPSWTAGMAEAGSAVVPSPNGEALTRPERPAWLRTAGSFLGTMIVVLAFPLFVVGLPIALAWRLVLEVGAWRHRSH